MSGLGGKRHTQGIRSLSLDLCAVLSGEFLRMEHWSPSSGYCCHRASRATEALPSSPSSTAPATSLSMTQVPAFTLRCVGRERPAAPPTLLHRSWPTNPLGHIEQRAAACVCEWDYRHRPRQRHGPQRLYWQRGARLGGSSLDPLRRHRGRGWGRVRVGCVRVFARGRGARRVSDCARLEVVRV